MNDIRKCMMEVTVNVPTGGQRVYKFNMWNESEYVRYHDIIEAYEVAYQFADERAYKNRIK